MSEYSQINKSNVNNIRAQIRAKNSSQPFLATTQDAKSVSTDYDTFPYPRWFRGEYNSVNPIIAEREAGWRIREDNCYKLSSPACDIDNFYPEHCFQVPCSTVFPCYPKHRDKYSDREALLVAINKSCISQFR